MAEPLHVAFIWHMHQPSYRSATTGAFEMPWVRMHALKDYLDMIETLAAYPALHQTFNLVPSLVEQLEAYAAGEFVDVYWEHTVKPAAELNRAEQAFVVQRMCDHSDHPRALSHPRYLQLARLREAQASKDPAGGARAFTVDEIRDLQVWFNLAWFDPQSLESEPLAELVRRGQGFREEDKQQLAHVQADILARTLPAYRDAAARGQVELSTSPYFHPILPLLVNTDSARIGAGDALLPPKRFAHREDAAEQIMMAMRKHERVFGSPPSGMWCSEQAVGEDVIPLLLDAGVKWTVADETVLARSLSGISPRHIPAPGAAGGTVTGTLTPRDLYGSYRLKREGGEVAIVFRDHTLSDLISFAYQSWDSREAASDLIRRLHDVRSVLDSPTPSTNGTSGSPVTTDGRGVPLVTIALDGENAWEYYPRDGRDFLGYLYEGLSADPAFRCVTISEHLRESPPSRSLEWLHTGSWINGDLRTWIGDEAHNAAWDLLHEARDLAASRLQPMPSPAPPGAVARVPLDSGDETEYAGAPPAAGSGASVDPAAAWQHVLIAEGSDWFWWFGNHHHTELDRVWDLGFRRHLQEVFRLLGEPVPTRLSLPLLELAPGPRPAFPQGEVVPVIDGLLGAGLEDPTAEWASAGYLSPVLPSTMQPAQRTNIREARFGWAGDRLFLLVIPDSAVVLSGLQVELHMTGIGTEEDIVIHMDLGENGLVRLSSPRHPRLVGATEAAWREVLEASIPLEGSMGTACGRLGLLLNIGRAGMTEHVFHTVGLDSLASTGE